MSTLVKKIRLFGRNGQPIVYRQMDGKVIAPTPRLNRRSAALGLVTSRSLTTARTNDERAYVREVAGYLLMIKKFEESLRLIRTMSLAEKRQVFSGLTVEQLVAYIGHFAKRSPKMSKKDLVDVAVGLA